MKKNVSVVRLIVATRISGPPASGKTIKEMPGWVASGSLYIMRIFKVLQLHAVELYCVLCYCSRLLSRRLSQRNAVCAIPV